MSRYRNFKLITYLSLRLPRPLLYRVADLFTAISERLDRPKREAVLANLRVILGPTASEKRIRSELRGVYRNFGWFLAEFFGFERFGGPFIDRHVDIVGREHLDEALAKGNGAILNTGHMSNWELGAAAGARLGYPVTGVAQLHPDPELNEYFRRQRASRGYATIPTEGAYRRCIEELRRNRVVCFVGDRDVGLGGIEVDFFGRPTPFPQGPARIALASKAPMMPGFVIRRANGCFSVVLEPAIPVPEEGGRREKARTMTQQFARIVEKYVRAFPAQWGVFFKVWPEDGELAPGGGFDMG